MKSTEDKMTGQRRFDGNLRGFQVADFADHDDVRVLTQKRAQTGGKFEPDLLANLHLVDAHQIVFDWIFRRRNIHIRLVELGKRGIQRGGFAAAGRTGDQNHAVRLVDRLLKIFQVLRIEAKLCHVELQVGLVQQTA